MNLDFILVVICLGGSGAIFGFIVAESCKRNARRWRPWLSLLGFLLLAVGSLVPSSPRSVETSIGTSAPTAGQSAGEPRYAPESQFQFHSSEVKIPGAHRWERRLPETSIPAAVDYMERGVLAWDEKYKCIGCHITGIYMMTRPALVGLGPPPPEVRNIVVTSMEPYLDAGYEQVLRTGHRTAQVVYAAAGLAEWDAHVARGLLSETDRTLRLMFRLQDTDGAWEVPTCWPPLQSSRFQLATVAARAIGKTPEWLEQVKGTPVEEKVGRLKNYLVNEPPPHDYARVWLLWAASEFEGILNVQKRERILETIFELQHADGGWSIRDFAQFHEWGDGSRVSKLESEAEFYLVPSDGHMTGLVVVALRDAGIPAGDPRIQRAIAWLERNQRASGRWWTRSLNSDRYHFITYSGSCFALLSFWKCNVFSRPNP